MAKEKPSAVIFPPHTIRYFLMFSLILFLTNTIILVSLYKSFVREHKRVLKIEEKNLLKQQQKLIQSYLKPVISDLLFLSEQYPNMGKFGLNKRQSRNFIQTQFAIFSRYKGVYDQIRCIDLSGNEKIRINLEKKHPVIVPENQLQSKKNRYYFQDTIKLNKGEIFVSPLDLNIEHGKIEIPFKPVLRFGTPVFNEKGEKLGVIVLNYLGSGLLSSFHRSNHGSAGDIMLLNPEGFYLCSPRQEEEWGFMLENRKDKCIVHSFPEEWDRILASREPVQFETRKGLFSVATVYPVPSLADAHTYYWKIVSHVSPWKIASGTLNMRNRLILLGVILNMFSFGAAFWISRVLVRRKIDQNALFQAAHYDRLTGLPNRAMFFDHLTQTITRAKRYDETFSLLFIDLDGFKSVNDTHGHDAGDLVLKKTAQKIRNRLRESDMVCRWGGDEFTVILNTTAAPEQISNVCQDLINAVAVPIPYGTDELKIGASIGIGIFPENALNANDLITKADDAMYTAKLNGKNRWHFSEEKLTSRHQKAFDKIRR